MLKQKLAFLRTLASLIVPKAQLHFKVMMYISIFVFLSPESCLKYVICIQNTLQSALIAMFLQQLKEAKIIHQEGLRTLCTLIFHSETT